MPWHPCDDLPGDGPPGGGRDPQPFWAHAEIDGTALDVLTTLARALATRWVAEDLAERFGHSVATAAATVVTGGGGTFDLWEEPGRLVCRVARSGAPDAVAAQPDPRRLRLVGRTAGSGRPGTGAGIVVERGPDRVTLELPVPFG